jgi:hypothetical protein
MTGNEFLDRLRARAVVFRALDAHVNGAKLIDEILTELEPIVAGSGEPLEALTLSEAAHESGYSRDHLGRQVRAGRIPNAGRRNAPRIERRYLPRKVRALPREKSQAMFDRRQIALSVVTSDEERHDG